MHKELFQVKGMHCASCSAVISRTLKKIPGVASCEINIASEKASIMYDSKIVTLDRMNNEINKLGYSLSDLGADHGKIENNKKHHNEHAGIVQTKEEKLHELSVLRSKVEFVLPITLLIFFLMMWETASNVFRLVPPLPLPMQLFNTVSFVLATIMVYWIGKPYLQATLLFMRYRVANMDTLIGIGTLAAYLYSSVIFLLPVVGDVLFLPQHTYFDVTIVVLGFVTLGKYLEATSKLSTGEAIEKLLNLQAKTAIIMKNKKEVEIPVSEVCVGDIVVVKSGMKIPVDGVITYGTSTIDESMINGEPLPVDKTVNDIVIGSTINKHGSFLYKATKVGADTMLAQIVSLVEQSQGSRAHIEQLVDKVSAVFVPAVLVIAVVAFLSWVFLGSYILGFSTALPYGLLAFIGVLVIACPCALGLATPTAIIVAVGKAAEQGILVKNAESLEHFQKVTTVLFDKTGTITYGKPTVTNIIPLDSFWSEKKLLEYAYSVENHSQHPLALAIINKANYEHSRKLDVDLFKEHEGFGVEGNIGEEHVVIRKPNNDDGISHIQALQQQGKTVVLIEIEKKVKGIIAVGDNVKKHAKETVAKLHELGLQTMMLTGDNKTAAAFIGNQVGIKTIHAEILPQDKLGIIKDAQKKGQFVAMIGDGMNDAPALSQANIGIAMATGSDIAIESADITFLGGDIYKLVQVIKLSKLTMRTIKQNLFWAFIYNIIGIPLAAGVFYPLFGIFLNPVFAGAAMAFSSVSVVSNSLLLKKKTLSYGISK